MGLFICYLVLEVFQQKREFKKQKFQRYQWMDGLDCKCNLYFQICYSCSFQHQSPLVHRPTYFTHLYSNFILIWYHKMAYGLLTGRGHLLSDHGRSRSRQCHMKSLIDFNAPQQKIATKLWTRCGNISRQKIGVRSPNFGPLGSL